MKKYHLGLALLAMGLTLASCGGSKTEKTTTTVEKTTESGKASATVSGTTETKPDEKESEATTTEEKKGTTYTGAAYDRESYADGNIAVTIGSTDISLNNEKVKITYDISIKNNSKTYQEFSITDLKMLSNDKNDFTSGCSATFDGKALTDDLSVGLYGNYSAKLHISASFTDTSRTSDTAYCNTFTLKDSGNNIYNLTVSPSSSYKFNEWETVTVYENDEVTLDNGFKFTTTGTSGYDADSYAFKSTEVLSITNTGSDASCLFNVGSIFMYSIADDSSWLTSVSGNSTLNDSSFHSYYEATDFTKDSVFKVDLTGTYYGVSESSLPAKVTFAINDLTGKTNYTVVLMLTTKDE